MSYWGKFLGGVAGFAMGGPVGALFGMALGHAADEGKFGGFAGVSGFPGMAGFTAGYGTPNPAAMLGGKAQVFAVSVTVLGAKLCKSDGPVSRAEIEAFKRVFLIPPQSAAEVARLFDSAKDSATGFEAYALRLGQAFADDPGALEQVLANLYHIARADGPVNNAERAFLAEVAQGFGLSPAAQARASGASAGGAGGRAASSGGDDPYKILGVVRTASYEEIRVRWKQLVREHHPDTLTAQGASPARVRQASEKVARINAAHDSIKRERGL
jgi:DnaJ like chaperone protein